MASVSRRIRRNMEERETGRRGRAVKKGRRGERGSKYDPNLGRFVVDPEKDSGFLAGVMAAFAAGLRRSRAGALMRRSAKGVS